MADLKKVFGLMFLGILVTALTAMYCAAHFELNLLTVGILFIGELALIWLMLRDGQPLYFLIFTVLNGYMLSSMVLYYEMSELITAFIVTAGFFAILSAIGYFTKRDLSSLSTILFACLLTLLGLLILDIFIENTMFSLLVSAGVVLLFAVMTVHDVSEIKKQPDTNHSVVAGAISLYLNFINMFIHIARIMFGLDD